MRTSLGYSAGVRVTTWKKVGLSQYNPFQTIQPTAGMALDLRWVSESNWDQVQSIQNKINVTNDSFFCEISQMVLFQATVSVNLGFYDKIA